MDKIVPRDELISIIFVAERIAAFFSCTPGEARDLLVDGMFHAFEKGVPSVFDAHDIGLARPLSFDEATKKIQDFANSHWWLEGDSEVERKRWENWRIHKYTLRHLIKHAGNRFSKTPSNEEISSRLASMALVDHLMTTMGEGRGGYVPEYLNPKHPRHSQKLAATIRAWEAVTDDQGKHPKTAITDWLEKHAVEYGLIKTDGTLNKEGIDDCAKVANWRPEGGAPKTLTKREK
ncbi:MAG TPA: hypothetical protein VMV25_00545 [Steroidobacteraceae bacterium]|nr:hypothetical protein [Steroidobacteraceae bacterium]